MSRKMTPLDDKEILVRALHALADDEYRTEGRWTQTSEDAVLMAYAIEEAHAVLLESHR